MVKAAAKNIPAGCICEIHPFFPREAAALAEEKDLLQATNAGDAKVPQLDREIDLAVNSYQQGKCMEYLEGINLGKGFLAVEHTQGALWTIMGT